MALSVQEMFLQGCFDFTVPHFSSLTEYLLCARDKNTERIVKSASGHKLFLVQ